MKLGFNIAIALLLVSTILPLIARADGASIAQASPAGLHAADEPTRDGDDPERHNGLVQHIIPPQVTDPAIDTFLDPHYVWVDSTSKPDAKLWVFLPSARLKPADFQLIAQEVVHLGYHVINLMYPNGDVILNVCNPLSDPDERESCYEDIRLQTLDGIQRSSFTNVNPPNSIYNRLAKLLDYLAATFPDEGWQRFEKHGAPEWSRITIAGHSQGGGNAALIGKLHHVARVVMFSSPPDGCVDANCQAAHWVGIGATPANRYYGLAHRREPLVGAELANWNALGLNVFGAPVAPETSAPPYGCAHMLLTNLNPAPGGNLHASTANDTATPRLADGTPALADAWRYLAANADESDSGNAKGRSPQRPDSEC